MAEIETTRHSLKLRSSGTRGRTLSSCRKGTSALVLKSCAWPHVQPRFPLSRLKESRITHNYFPKSVALEPFFMLVSLLVRSWERN